MFDGSSPGMLNELARRACGRADAPVLDFSHRGTIVGIRLKHFVEQGTDAGIDTAEIWHPTPLLDELKLAPAHIELLPGQRLEQHQPKTVYVGFCSDVAAEKADLLR